MSKLSLGQRVADWVVSRVGSWPFILGQSLILGAWILWNLAYRSWDPAPFVLLNLILSFQAAYTGPMVLMSDIRQREEDRLEAQEAYANVQLIMERLDGQEVLLRKVLEGSPLDEPPDLR